MKTNLRWRLAGLAIIVSVLSGCLKSEDPAPSAPKAYISLMHLAPTAPALDVFFDNSRVSNTPFTPGSVTSGYNAVDRGIFAIRFKKTSSDSLVAEVPLTHYDSLSFYTLVIYNQQVDGPAKVVRIKDDFAGLESTKPYYRFFHASPNTGAIDLYIDNIRVESDRSHIDNAGYDPFNKFSATTSGHHTIQARLAGTDTVVATANIDMIQGNAYTFFLKGLEGGTGNNQLTLSILRAI